jgi:hypothetical protein
MMAGVPLPVVSGSGASAAGTGGSGAAAPRHASWSSSSLHRAHSTTGGLPTSTPVTSWPTWSVRRQPTWSSSRRRRRPSRPAAIPLPGRPGRGRPLLVDVHRLASSPHSGRRQQAAWGRDRLRVPRRRGHQAERGRDYTYVIGSESQRAAISRLPGVTFQPFSTTQASRLYLLGLRDVVVSSSFAHSPPGVTQASDRRRPSWVPTTRGRRSARWRPSPPKARRHALR